MVHFWGPWLFSLKLMINRVRLFLTNRSSSYRIYLFQIQSLLFSYFKNASSRWGGRKYGVVSTPAWGACQRPCRTIRASGPSDVGTQPGPSGVGTPGRRPGHSALETSAAVEPTEPKRLAVLQRTTDDERRTVNRVEVFAREEIG